MFIDRRERAQAETSERVNRAMVGGGWGAGRGREEEKSERSRRPSHQEAKKPRDLHTQIADLYRNQRNWGMGSPAQSLAAEFRVGIRVCQPGFSVTGQCQERLVDRVLF